MDDVDPREEAGFLTRSAHRTRVLQQLARAPADRTSLEEATGATRVTLGRILSAFEDRNWIRRRDATYYITPLGETVVDGLELFIHSLSASHTLTDVIEYLPVDELDIPLRALHDATLLRPTAEEPAKYLRAYIPVASRAKHIRGCWSVLDPDLWAHHEEWVTDGRLEVTFVFDRSIIDPIRSRRPYRYIDQIVQSPNSAVYEFDGQLPTTVLVADTTVFIFLVGEGGYKGVVVSDDDTVLAWATDTIESYRERAVPMKPVSDDQ